MPKYRFNLDEMVFPDGRKKGVIPEDKNPQKARMKVADRCDPVKGQIEIIPQKFWEEYRILKHHQAREDRFRFTLDQNSIGSCAAESAAAVKGSLDTKQNFDMVLYNPWFIYQTTSGGRDNGSVIGDNMEFLRDRGCAPEEVWPRSKGWRTEPGAEVKRIAKFFTVENFYFVETTEELVSALLQGFDIHGGYSGHAVCFMQYKGGRKVKFKNSWGDWGVNGFGELSLDKVYFPYGCYAATNARWWQPEEWSPRNDQKKLDLATTVYMNAINEIALGKDKLAKLVKSDTRSADDYRSDLYADIMAQYGLSV